jgi:arylsulfatase A-like enzyme
MLFVVWTLTRASLLTGRYPIHHGGEGAVRVDSP